MSATRQPLAFQLALRARQPRAAALQGLARYTRPRVQPGPACVTRPGPGARPGVRAGLVCRSFRANVPFVSRAKEFGSRVVVACIFEDLAQRFRRHDLPHYAVFVRLVGNLHDVASGVGGSVVVAEIGGSAVALDDAHSQRTVVVAARGVHEIPQFGGFGVRLERAQRGQRSGALDYVGGAAAVGDCDLVGSHSVSPVASPATCRTHDLHNRHVCLLNQGGFVARNPKFAHFVGLPA